MNRKELLGRYAAGERDFRGADLTRVDFIRADLTRVDFIRADLTGVDFIRADLTGVNIDGRRRPE